MKNNAKKDIFIFCCVIISMLTGCSDTNSNPQRKLESEIKAVISLASESQLFIEDVEGDRTTDEFAQAQALYLQEQVGKVAEDFSKIKVGSDLQNTLDECKKQLDSLRSVLSTLSLAPQNRSQLASIRKEMMNIQGRLKKIAQTL